MRFQDPHDGRSEGGTFRTGGPPCPPSPKPTKNGMGTRIPIRYMADGDRADTEVRPYEARRVSRIEARRTAMVGLVDDGVNTGPGVDLVDHVGIVVRDINSCLTLYADTLGFRAFGDETLPEVGVRVIYLSGGPPGSTTLQLIEPTRAGPLRDFLEAQGDGLHHICLAVADIPEALARLAPGAEVRIAMGGRGRRACFLPERRRVLRIELTEIEPWAVRRGGADSPTEEGEASA